MFSEPDGDALVGRTVAQLDFSPDQFDVLPLHFTKKGIEIIQGVGWNTIITDWGLYPNNFKTNVIPFLAACLIYHYREEHLQKYLPSRHPIFAQVIFTNVALYDQLKNEVVLTHASSSEANMHASGVPAVIAVCREIRTYEQRNQKFRLAMEQRAKELEERLVNEVDAVKTHMDSLIPKIVQTLASRFQIQGVMPFTVEDMRSCLAEMISKDSFLSSINQKLSSHDATLKEMVEIMRNGGRATSETTPDQEVQVEMRRTNGKIFHWPNSDRLHTVPPDFRFPSFPVASMWTLWQLGNPRLSIQPYKHISPNYDLVNDKDKTNFSRTKKVMDAIIARSIEKGIITSPTDVTATNQKDVFDTGFPILVREVYVDKHPSRISDLNINTLSNRMYKKNM
jgi:hypothetical protein